MSGAKPRKPAATGSTLPAIKDWHAIAVLSTAVLVFFRDIILQKAYFWEDFLYYFYPLRSFAAVSMARGEMPLWNPYTFNGMPFQADIQTALFYIPNLVMTLFVGGADKLNFYWLELMIIAHFILAGVTMYYLARSFGLERWYALFSGLIYSLSGFMIAHTIHQVVICQVAWFPLVVMLFRRSLLERSPLHMILCGLTLGHAVLAGFPQLSLYIFFFLFLLFAFEFVSASNRGGIKAALPMIPLAAGAILIAVALTAVQLLPTLELAPLSQRAEISYQKSLEGTLTWERLIILLVPKFFGESGAQVNTFWLQVPGWYYWETCLYLGIAALVCAAFALPLIRSNRYVGFFVGISVFSLLFAVGDQFFLHRVFFDYVPGFSTFRNPARMALLMSLVVPILAGIGLERIVTRVAIDAKRLQRSVGVLAVGGIVLWAILSSGVLQPSQAGQAAQQIHSIAQSAATTALLFLLLFCGVVVAFARSVIGPTVAIGLVLCLQFVDMHIFGFQQNNSGQNPAEYFKGNGQTVNFLKGEMEKEIFRVNSRQGGAMILDRNQGMIDRMFLMEGYTPLGLQRYLPPARNWDQICEMLNVKYRIVVDEQRRTMSLGTSPKYLPRAFVVYDAMVISDEAKLKLYMGSDQFDPAKTVVLEEVPPVLAQEGGEGGSWSAAITSYRLNSIAVDVSMPRDGYLVMSEIYYPGWVATVDGAPERVYRADWNLRAIPMRSGQHKVEMKFEPEPFRSGMWISLATIGLSAVGIVYFVRKKRTPTV